MKAPAAGRPVPPPAPAGGRDRARLHPAVGIVTVAAILFGLAAAVRLAWVCDDAFISFRYARHLVHGLGLVFNAGERVEGYSNFLWTLLVAAAVRLGADPVVFSQVAGVACYAATLALLARTGLRMAGARRGAAATPLAAAGWALHPHAQVFATGGLETALFTLLVTAVVVTTVEARRARDHAWAGSLAVLAALTRPDGALFLLVPILGAALGPAPCRRWRAVALALLPTLIVYGPYLLWKHAYYGDLLPNTFYAKSADRPYYAQGLRYVGLYFGTYAVLLLGLVGPAWQALWPERGDGGAVPPGEPWRGRRAAVLLLAACGLYLLFVLHVGGDFMFARFVLPVSPLLLLGVEQVLQLARAPLVRLTAAATVALALALARSPAEMADLDNSTGIVEEGLFYPPGTVDAARWEGEELRRALVGTHARVGIYGSQAMLAYFADFPVAIEAHTGLTDPTIARRPAAVRGRVGHEKKVPLGYLRSRGVNFVFSSGLQSFTPTPVTRLRIGSVEGLILVYERDLMRALRGRPGVEFVDFERFLDAYLARAGERTPAELRRDLVEITSYYFDHSDDPQRAAAFQRALGVPAAAPAPATPPGATAPLPTTGPRG